MSVERYKNAMNAAIEIYKLRVKIKELNIEIASNLTGKELISRKFDDKFINDAFKLIDADFETNQYVKTNLIVNGIQSISLHEDMNDLSGRAMRELLSEIDNKDIIRLLQ